MFRSTILTFRSFHRCNTIFPSMHMYPHAMLHCFFPFSFSIVGVEVCGELRRLVASHNFIDRLDGLQGCPKLVYLDLSVNLLTGLSLLPSLSSLNTLNINNNKVRNKYIYHHFTRNIPCKEGIIQHILCVKTQSLLLFICTCIYIR